MATASSDMFPQPIDGPDLFERDLELIPIPTVQVVRAGPAFEFLAVNRAYRLAGLGVNADRSPMLALLSSRIDAFLRSTDVRSDFDWSIGQVIDSRYYRVTLARPTPALRDRCQVAFIDLTAQVHTERSLRREMTTDSLTGLPNREGFSDMIEAVQADRGGHAVLVIDLDRFGRLNACLGGLAGDELLITVARRIKGALRARDSLARIGGDEFGILMAVDDDPAEATRLAERIQRALSAPFRLSDYEIGVECSIGIAHGNDAIDDVEELIRNAQFAVKRAKTGRQVESYQTQAFALAREQFAMETALRRAIEERQLRLAFQPICDLASGSIVSFEALARWRDESGVEHEPSAFIPVAEESGLIVPLGRWAMDEAARTLRWWDEECGGDCGMRVAVNLSAIQMQRDDIAPVVEAALIRHNLAGSRFNLELTESAIVSDPDRIAGIMHALKALGTTLAMDDFGTGYSNLAYLQKLPIDILKIDRSFVSGMLADRDKIAIVRAVLSLAQALGMKTTAEGVESNELAQTLAALGCTYGQGYLYARPLEAADALSMIVAARASATASSAS
ncbi:bifunctional diguanylate cyclase/phosphodiesterase [Sphingomonadaceae bacterium OTU29MARTA1]|uniref:putative bifunctional diguanylate cyclase/phosphodiesterase n=1 Tax=Sphingomonas sp. Leaf37 TaxID=2876552 RepID=UPI001E5B8F67|nr:bifunctional diguanylate cyclase/phosphodiesterase [Sphingomonas sp. Leaf37]USU08617.1 bifunctional diguanylate cyclase/phosphodiesterase [Sphingomonadaceae bacterium OTU29MARTA1]USU12094.1 bifunctional diguanylate cyclase/phosphodiesterase [Sphingomonadaceae bacterium OTU29THOMA1]